MRFAPLFFCVLNNMTGVYLGYHNQNFSVNANITVQVPNSGFYLKFGRIGSWENITTQVENEREMKRMGPPCGEPFVSVVSFSGYSGYIFDQNMNFVGGYLKDESFDLEFNAFYETGKVNRLSYKINNTLIANNLSLENGDIFIDSMIFEDFSDTNNLIVTLKTETGSPTVLAGNTGLYILSSDSFYLADNSNITINPQSTTTTAAPTTTTAAATTPA